MLCIRIHRVGLCVSAMHSFTCIQSRMTQGEFPGIYKHCTEVLHSCLRSGKLHGCLATSSVFFKKHSWFQTMKQILHFLIHFGISTVHVNADSTLHYQYLICIEYHHEVINQQDVLFSTFHCLTNHLFCLCSPGVSHTCNWSNRCEDFHGNGRWVKSWSWRS